MAIAGFGFRRTVGQVVVPRTQIHQRLRVQRRRVQIVGICRYQLRHRVCIRAIERRAPLTGFAVARRNRVDVGLLLRRFVRAQRLRGLQRLPCQGHCFGRHRRVDVRPVRQRDAPPADAARRIEACSFLERANRFGVVEAVHQREGLIEVLLRLLRFRGDRHVQRTDAVQQRCGGSIGLNVREVLRGGRGVSAMMCLALGFRIVSMTSRHENRGSRERRQSQVIHGGCLLVAGRRRRYQIGASLTACTDPSREYNRFE